VNEFVEECRREWRRLGVPDPIANEMAADLTADIDEAEAEGGSAEDVLGNSIFDPRTFAAAWAGARGVIAPALLAPPVQAPALANGPPRRRAVLAVAMSAFAALFVLAAVALLVGRHSASAAVSVRRILPGSARLFGPGSVGPPFRSFVFGPQFTGPNNGLFIVFAVVMLLLGFVVLGFAVMYWSPWSRHKFQTMARVSGRNKWWDRSSR
jgi:hypothetical protein